MLIDWLVIAVYLVGVAAIGMYSAGKVKTSSSFFISDRNFGKLLMTFFTFGTGTNTDQAVTVASKTYTAGASGIWYQWLWLFSTPFYWLLAPLFRRMRAVTTSDYLNARYGQSVAVLFAIFGMAQLSINIGVVLKASGALVTSVSGGAIDPNFAIVAMTILFVSYGIVGGLHAAILTDFVQGVLTVALSFLILPFALDAVGGIAALRESVDPSTFAIVAPGEITVLYVVIISINALVGWVAAPYSMQMCGAGKTEQEARVGLVCGMFLKRICTIAWVLTGMAAVAIYAGQDIDPDLVWGTLARDLLPTIAPGLIGVFIACMLAAVMSSCDCFMVSSAALFTENIYKPLIRPGQSEKHYIRIGRITSAVVVIAGIIFAFNLTSVVEGLEIFWIVQAMMGVPIWVSFFWRRATSAAAWVSTLGGFAAWFFTSTVQITIRAATETSEAVIWTIWDFNARFAEMLPDFMTGEVLVNDVLTLKISLPWQMIIYLSTAMIAMVVVSLVTTPPDKEKLDRVYETLRTPVVAGEPEVEPLTLPPGTPPAPREVLIDHPDFEIVKPSLSTVLGFLAAWVGVAALIGAFVLILRM